MTRDKEALKAAKFNIFDEEGFIAGAKWEREAWLAAIEELQETYKDEMPSGYYHGLNLLKQKMGL